MSTEKIIGILFFPYLLWQLLGILVQLFVPAQAWPSWFWTGQKFRACLWRWARSCDL